MWCLGVMSQAVALASVPLLEPPLNGSSPQLAALPGRLAQTGATLDSSGAGAAIDAHGRAHLPRPGESLSPDTAPFPQKLVVGAPPR